MAFSYSVMAGTRVRPSAGPSVNFVLAIHVFLAAKTWMPATSAGMTNKQMPGASVNRGAQFYKNRKIAAYSALWLIKADATPTGPSL
jgi:hypothetical protein